MKSIKICSINFRLKPKVGRICRTFRFGCQIFRFTVEFAQKDVCLRGQIGQKLVYKENFLTKILYINLKNDTKILALLAELDSIVKIAGSGFLKNLENSGRIF